MGIVTLNFALDIFVISIGIYIATKFAFVKAELMPILMIGVFVSTISLIPSFGWILGLCTFIYLLIKVTDASLIDSIWVVVFTKPISFFVTILVHKLVT